MIHFSLHCAADHEFEGWFRGNDDFEKQLERGLVSCPVCGSLQVGKALMAPAVSTARRKEKIAVGLGEMQRKMVAEMREIGKKVRENADYVGDQFAEETRKMHFGETEARGIYGEASREDVVSLIDDGVEIMPLPSLPEDSN